MDFRGRIAMRSQGGLWWKETVVSWRIPVLLCALSHREIRKFKDQSTFPVPPHLTYFINYCDL